MGDVDRNSNVDDNQTSDNIEVVDTNSNDIDDGIEWTLVKGVRESEDVCDNGGHSLDDDSNEEVGFDSWSDENEESDDDEESDDHDDMMTLMSKFRILSGNSGTSAQRTQQSKASATVEKLTTISSIGRKCHHFGTENTPQWRTGMQDGTLIWIMEEWHERSCGFLCNGRLRNVGQVMAT
ncbi:hypothetical protein RIF29_26057 [Crotalaria pallida]|uniref:Uncharacterized protein n=1 Tax=Crotalaria pallida TaxID=3830 RepID=A0AAN9EM93_CROPI